MFTDYKNNKQLFYRDTPHEISFLLSLLFVSLKGGTIKQISLEVWFGFAILFLCNCPSAAFGDNCGRRRVRSKLDDLLLSFEC